MIGDVIEACKVLGLPPRCVL